jgi:hypothetical protein
MDSKYKSLTEWRKADKKAYHQAYLKNIIPEICKIFGWTYLFKTRRSKKYWSLELCKEEALKYTTKTQWRKNCKVSYVVSQQNGWFEECVVHMKKRNKSIKWTLEQCKQDALKYTTRTEWQKNSVAGANAAYRNGWFEECVKHMENKKSTKPSNYWTLERCKQDALKYNSKTEWKNNSPSALIKAFMKGWINECCLHMVNTNLRRSKNYWTIELCMEDALKYNTKTKWKKNSKGAYTFALKNNCLNECCKHMKNNKPNNQSRDLLIKSTKGYWTLERCKEEALKYISRTEWQRSYSASVARRNGWVEECTKHMKPSTKPQGYWTFERCKEEALKYTSRTEWQKNSPSSFAKSFLKKWTNDICSHMVSLKSRRTKNYWTIELCMEDALKYNTKAKWKKHSPSSVGAARKNGWLSECIKHMK